MNNKEILTRLENLEKAFLQSQQNNVQTVERADKTILQEADIKENSENIKANAEDISSNRDGIMETFETSMLNTDDIAVLREGLEEVYELLLGESEE